MNGRGDSISDRSAVSIVIVSVDVSDPRATLAELEASSRFLVQQVFKPVANEYRISIPPPGGTD